jgi:hypothetical protein
MGKNGVELGHEASERVSLVHASLRPAASLGDL